MAKLIVVVDMQKDFIDGALGSAEAVKIVDRCAHQPVMPVISLSLPEIPTAMIICRQRKARIFPFPIA